MASPGSPRPSDDARDHACADQVCQPAGAQDAHTCDTDKPAVLTPVDTAPCAQPSVAPASTGEDTADSELTTLTASDNNEQHAQKISAAAQLLRQCPPGETADVLQDLADILGGAQLLSDLLPALADHNKECCAAVQLARPDGTHASVMLTRYNCDGDSVFWDPSTGTRFSVNHFDLTAPPVLISPSVGIELCPPRLEQPGEGGKGTREADLSVTDLDNPETAEPSTDAADTQSNTPAADECSVSAESAASGAQVLNQSPNSCGAEPSESISSNSVPSEAACNTDANAASASSTSNMPLSDPRTEMCRAIAVAAEEYIAETMRKAGRSQAMDTPDGCVLVIVGDRVQPKNMQAGQWRSVWHCVREGDTLRVSGSVVVLMHSYEEGNVQLRAHRAESFDVSAASPDAKEIAKAVVAGVRAREDAVQLAINSAYSHLTDRVLKRLRRQLPVSRERLNWAKIASYRVGTDAAGQTKAASQL